ncbi:MAG: hypothetical protein Q4B75_09115 [Eubacteriales bacterium]|nr:hypothetical protein [Eubacteriales bacterium]
MILSAVTQTQPDYVALAMVIVLLLLVIVAVLRKRFASSPAQPQSAVSSGESSAEVPQILVAPGSAGSVKLHSVEPKVAAMLMAIVANKTGKPLNELRFISIREVTES